MLKQNRLYGATLGLSVSAGALAQSITVSGTEYFYLDDEFDTHANSDTNALVVSTAVGSINLESSDYQIKDEQYYFSSEALQLIASLGSGGAFALLILFSQSSDPNSAELARTTWDEMLQTDITPSQIEDAVFGQSATVSSAYADTMSFSVVKISDGSGGYELGFDINFGSMSELNGLLAGANNGGTYIVMDEQGGVLAPYGTLNHGAPKQGDLLSVSHVPISRGEDSAPFFLIKFTNGWIIAEATGPNTMMVDTTGTYSFTQHFADQFDENGVVTGYVVNIEGNLGYVELIDTATGHSDIFEFAATYADRGITDDPADQMGLIDLDTDSESWNLWLYDASAQAFHVWDLDAENDAVVFSSDLSDVFNAINLPALLGLEATDHPNINVGYFDDDGDLDLIVSHDGELIAYELFSDGNTENYTIVGGYDDLYGGPA